MRKAFVAWLSVAALACANPVGAAEKRESLLVFAAASLTDVMGQVAKDYTKASGVDIKLSFAASSALAKQIESGAKADVFFSADQEWMDYLQQRSLIDKRSRRNVVGNALVLIAPAESKVAITLGPRAPLLQALGKNGRVATGDPDSVPAGKYAKAALTSLELWDALHMRIARAENVRVALMYVARGETPLGIVYSTDVIAEPKVRVVATFPAKTHTPITYPVAVTSVAKSGAVSFVEFLSGAIAQRTFEKAGFTVLPSITSSNMQTGCTSFQFDVSRELKLLSGKPDVIEAGVGPSVAFIEEGRTYAVQLRPQAQVQLARTPQNSTQDGAYAGAVNYVPTKAGALRVSLSGSAWIDAIAAGKLLESTRHSGSHDCKALRKSVEFKVEKGKPIVLQLSGGATPSVNLVATQ